MEYVQGGERQSEDAQTSCWKECRGASYLTLGVPVETSLCAADITLILITYSDSQKECHHVDTA